MIEGKIYFIVFLIFMLLDLIVLFWIIGIFEKGINLIYLLV